MVKIRFIELLLEKISLETKESLDHHGFGEMSDKISTETIEVSQRYLNDLYHNVQTKLKAGTEYAKPRRNKLDVMAKFLKFENFNEFCKSCESVVPDILQACCGTWWSYVKANSGKSILKAPARIFPDDGGIKLELKGSERVFTGMIELRGVCISGFLESGTRDKRIGLVFKVGSSKQMELLQGVFCGMSSADDPIAGLEVLVRENELPYEAMAWSSHELHDKMIGPVIRKFFSDTVRNSIKIHNISGFKLEDLI